MTAAVRTGKLEVKAVIREVGYSNFAKDGRWKCSPSNGRQPEKHPCRTERDGDDLISMTKPGFIVTTHWRKDINVINAISRRQARTNSKVRTCAGKAMASVLWDSAGVLLKRGASHCRVTCADITELSGFDQTGGRIKTWSCMITPDCGMEYSPSSALQSPFCTLRLPPFWPPEGRTPETRFCGWQAETACVMSSDASAKGFTRPAYSVSPKAGKVYFKRRGLYESNLNFINNIPTIYVNFIVTVTTVFFYVWVSVHHKVIRIYKEPTWRNLAVCLLVTAIILYMFLTLFASILRST
jgi:hypothetical protein